MDLKKVSPQKQYLLGELARLQEEHEQANASFKMKREINYFLEEAKDQGFTDMAQLNQMVANQIANQAILYEDKGILDFIGHIETAGGANYGNTMYAMDLTRKVGDQIDRKKDQDEKRRREDLRFAREEERRAMLIEIGEFYNNKNEPPEGWDYNTAWTNLRRKLNSLGMFDTVASMEDRSYTLDERNQTEEKISLKELQQNKELRNKLVNMIDDDGVSALYSWGLTNRAFDTDALDYLTKQAERIVPYTSINKYTDTEQYFQRFLNNFAAVKVKEFLPGFSDDPMKLKPKAFDNLVAGFLIRFHDIARSEYHKVARMDGGNKNYSNWTDEQHAAFSQALNLNTDYNKGTSELAELQRDADSQLSSLMTEHLQKDKSYFNTDTITTPDVKEFYTRVFGKEPPKGKKVFAKDLLLELERAKLRTLSSKDFFDTDFENYIEEELLGGSIDYRDPQNQAEIDAIVQAVNSIQKEILNLIKKEEEGVSK